MDRPNVTLKLLRWQFIAFLFSHFSFPALSTSPCRYVARSRRRWCILLNKKVDVSVQEFKTWLLSWPCGHCTALPETLLPIAWHKVTDMCGHTGMGWLRCSGCRGRQWKSHIVISGLTHMGFGQNMLTDLTYVLLVEYVNRLTISHRCPRSARDQGWLRFPFAGVPPHNDDKPITSLHPRMLNKSPAARHFSANHSTVYSIYYTAIYRLWPSAKDYITPQSVWESILSSHISTSIPCPVTLWKSMLMDEKPI